MSYKLVDIVCADDIGLPPQLVGSPRQIAWAEDVRIKIAIQMEKVQASFLKRCDPLPRTPEITQFVDRCLAEFEAVLNRTNAQAWIKDRFIIYEQLAYLPCVVRKCLPADQVVADKITRCLFPGGRWLLE